MNFWDLSIIKEEPHCLSVRNLQCRKDYLKVRPHARSVSVMLCKHTECPPVAGTVTQWHSGMSPYSGGANGQGQLQFQIYIGNTEYNVHVILPFTSSFSSVTTATSGDITEGETTKSSTKKSLNCCMLPAFLLSQLDFCCEFFYSL